MTYRSDARQPVTQQQATARVEVPAQVNSAPSFSDNRASMAANLQLKAMMDASPRHEGVRALKQLMASGTAGRAAPLQMMEDEEKLLQGKFEAVPRAGMEEEEPLQGKFAGSAPAQLTEQEAPKANHTGLPDQLKSGIENLSGMSMDHVKVHYNSSQPAQLNAHAYAQGSEIHVAPGQEQHVPHEAWHVVQQAQGRVKPTLQMKGGVPVNDDSALEAEADVMGAEAARWTGQELRMPDIAGAALPNTMQRRLIAPVISGAAALAGPNNQVNTDTVALGPTNVSAYTATRAVAVQDRDAALVAARTEYRTIGTGFQGRFLSEPALRQQCGAQRPVAAHVYDVLLQNGGIPAPPAVLNTPQQKQAYLQQLGLANVLTAANLEHLRNDAHIPLNDPVKVSIRADYGQNGAERLALTVDFTEGQKGYVSVVDDTASGTNASIMDRPNYAGEYPVPETRGYKDNSYKNWAARDFLQGKGQEQANSVATFSNVHHTATNADAATQIGRLGQQTTREELEGGVDAITKLVAEGGRFVCVEGLGTAIRNNSIFYTQLPQGGNFRCIEFRSLWKLWQSQFNGVYGVTNLAVANYLAGVLRANHGMTEIQQEPAQTGHNYNIGISAVR